MSKKNIETITTIQSISIESLETVTGGGFAGLTGGVRGGANIGVTDGEDEVGFGASGKASGRVGFYTR